MALSLVIRHVSPIARNRCRQESGSVPVFTNRIVSGWEGSRMNPRIKPLSLRGVTELTSYRAKGLYAFCHFSEIRARYIVLRLKLGWLGFLLFVLPSAFPQSTITIGFTVSKTGALNVDSLEQYRGFELWRDQTNAAGGIKAGGKSYKVQFASYDDESNTKRVQQLYTRMILEDKADFLFSPYSSSITDRKSVVTEQYGKIMLTTGAAEPKTYTLRSEE